MSEFDVFCRSCEGRTTVHISDGALGAVANCECGRAFFVSNETNKTIDRRVQ